MAKKEKKSKVSTLVCFVLDETGSMLTWRNQTISGYNEYVDALRKSKKTKMMLTKFNSAAITLGDIEPIAEAITLNTENYRPDHLTPLYDAIGQSISRVDEQIDPKNVIFVIMSDGLENASKEFTQDGIFKLIDTKKEEGWSFVYLGANQDAYVAGGLMGIPRAATANYAQSKTAETFTAAAAGTQRLVDDPTSTYKWTKDELEEMEE